jgi:hypothetical protein
MVVVVGANSNVAPTNIVPHKSAESHDMADEEENESYNYVYDQDNADGDEGAAAGGDMGIILDGQGATGIQQDMSQANLVGQEGAHGTHGEVTAATGTATHHGKAKYQKIPAEKYAHIIHHSPRLTIILNILET